VVIGKLIANEIAKMDTYWELLYSYVSVLSNPYSGNNNNIIQGKVQIRKNLSLSLSLLKL
jgi:hypothetical protein